MGFCRGSGLLPDAGQVVKARLRRLQHVFHRSIGIMKKQDTAGIGADIDVTNAVCLEQSFGDAGGEPVGSYQGGQPGARPASSRNVQRR